MDSIEEITEYYNSLDDKPSFTKLTDTGISDDKENVFKFVNGFQSQQLKKNNLLESKQDEIDRLSKRDCNATVQLCYETEGNPFEREDLKIVDVGVSDNVYIVESEVLNNIQKENTKLKERVKELENRCTNFMGGLSPKDTTCVNCGKQPWNH